MQAYQIITIDVFHFDLLTLHITIIKTFIYIQPSKSVESVNVTK